MFGSRSGSPYPGATGLLTSGNASAGPGGPLSAAGNVPPPSRGMPQSSVYNQSLDNEPNVVPSQLMYPSAHPDLKGPENMIREGDFVFVLRDMSNGLGPDHDWSYAGSYRTRHARLSKDEVPLLTVQKLNALLRQIASADIQHAGGPPAALQAVEDGAAGAKVLFHHSDYWWQIPELVAQWAIPFGAALNSIQLNRYGGGGDPDNRQNRQDWQAHNIVVSRKANVKNNFYTTRTRRGEKWHSQSMQRVGVQYNLENVTMVENNAAVPVVQVNFLLLDDPTLIRGTRIKQEYTNMFDGNKPVSSRRTLQPKGADKPEYLEIDSTTSHPRIMEPSFRLFEEKPMGDPATRVIVQIGRVLHSAPRQPSAYECLNSCHNKQLYDSLKPIEIELGCP